MSTTPETHDRASLLALFRSNATDVVEKDMSHVAEASVIGELGIDSLAVLEIIGSMERALRIRIPDEALTGVETVADLLAVVEARLATRTAP